LTPKQKLILKPKRFKNRFSTLLQQKRLLKFFYQKPGSAKVTTLEKKIDVALFRVNFCSSIRSARQAILHGKVFLNNQPLSNANYFLKPGDSITMKSGARLHSKLSRKTPSFEVNYAIMTAIYLYPSQFIVTPFQWHA
jgi:ribosomal protein S4